MQQDLVSALLGTGGDVDMMGTRCSHCLVSKIVKVGNGWRCRYDGNGDYPEKARD